MSWASNCPYILRKARHSCLERVSPSPLERGTTLAGLLKELADSSGNILENKGLLNSLNETKAQSQVVGKSLKDSEKLQRTLDEKREVYQVVAEIGPDHAKSFEVEVELRGEVVGRASGRSKKDAEQAAARLALETLAAPAIDR